MDTKEPPETETYEEYQKCLRLTISRIYELPKKMKQENRRIKQSQNYILTVLEFSLKYNLGRYQ